MTSTAPGTVIGIVGAKTKKVASKKLLIIATVIVVIAVIIGVWYHLHKNGQTAKGDTAITAAQRSSDSTNYAQTNLQKKNYAAAVQGYISASNAYFYQKNYNQAKASLIDCINNVPDDQVPYYVYSSLYTVAKQLKDTELEKSSLQTAITKASAPGSDAPAGTVSDLQTILQGIK